jgi:uncharacterized protein (TIGR01777 family)
MHLLITGGTGFIGSALIQSLIADDHQVTILSRSASGNSPSCHYVRTLDDVPPASRIDAVINLAGASLAGKRWNAAYKRELVASRTETTRTLIDYLAQREQRPAVLLSASAIGIYGHRGDRLLDENAAVGSGFAADLCRQWESEAGRAADLGIRTCIMRFGVVLDAGGGALTDMARSFRMGIASWPGTGDQYFSWVHRADVVAAMRFLLQGEQLHGVFNVTAPNPVTHREFGAALRTHFRTLPGMPIPGAALRLLLGEMADELLLNGQRVLPSALDEAGFGFRYPHVESALAGIFSGHAGVRLP